MKGSWEWNLWMDTMLMSSPFEYSIVYCSLLLLLASGADPGRGGGSWGSKILRTLLRDPKTSKRGKNVACVHAYAAHFSS